MSQPENAKRKIIKILENLSIQLQGAGLSKEIQVKTTNDPWIDLQSVHSRLVSYIRETKQEKQGQLQKLNEIIVLDCFKQFINIHLQLSKLSKMLYEGDYSLDIYKTYRKLYQQITTASNCLYQYESNDQPFLKQKEELINQSLQICQQIQATTSMPLEQKSQKSMQENDNILIIESLKKEIQILNDLIRQNDEEFTLQIQRYNNALFDLQQSNREYEVRFDKVREYEAIIEELQHKIIRLKEEKYRDEMLIDNMSKKIRHYEKERGGVDVFLSPRNNYSRKNMLSPGSRANNQSIFSSHGMQLRQYKNGHERFTSN